MQTSQDILILETNKMQTSPYNCFLETNKALTSQDKFFVTELELAWTAREWGTMSSLGALGWLRRKQKKPEHNFCCTISLISVCWEDNRKSRDGRTIIVEKYVIYKLTYVKSIPFG